MFNNYGPRAVGQVEMWIRECGFPEKEVLVKDNYIHWCWGECQSGEKTSFHHATQISTRLFVHVS